MELSGQLHAPASISRTHPRYPLNRGLDRIQCKSGPFLKGGSLFPLPGFEFRTVQPVTSRYTDWTIPSWRKTSHNSYNNSTCLSVAIHNFIKISSCPNIKLYTYIHTRTYTHTHRHTQMMQDVQVTLNQELPWLKQHSTRRRLFLPANLNQI